MKNFEVPDNVGSLETRPPICRGCLNLAWIWDTDTDTTEWYCTRIIWPPKYGRCGKIRKRMETGRTEIVIKETWEDRDEFKLGHRRTGR